MYLYVLKVPKKKGGLTSRIPPRMKEKELCIYLSSDIIQYFKLFLRGFDSARLTSIILTLVKIRKMAKNRKATTKKKRVVEENEKLLQLSMRGSNQDAFINSSAKNLDDDSQQENLEASSQPNEILVNSEKKSQILSELIEAAKENSIERLSRAASHNYVWTLDNVKFAVVNCQDEVEQYTPLM